MKSKILTGLAIVLGVLALGACTSTGNGSSSQQAAKKALGVEQTASANGLISQERTQPIPARPWSQLRQNLIEIETAQMDTTQTTSFMFNQGVQDPVQSCPSIGFPIASTSELTNPEQKVIEGNSGNDHGNVTLPQIDPNGVYAGSSTGTYVMCLDAQGRAYADYWEGFVQTVTGPARWNSGSHAVELIGPPSFNFTKGKGK